MHQFLSLLIFLLWDDCNICHIVRCNKLSQLINYGTYHRGIHQRLRRACAFAQFLPEPLLFTHTKYGSRRRFNQKSDISPHWMAALGRLKNEFTEGKKYEVHNLMRWLILYICIRASLGDPKLIFEPQRDKTNKMTCAPSKDSDQPGHPPSLIRIFAVRMKHWDLSYPLSAQRRL